MVYAQIDDTGLCVGISNLSGVVDAPGLIAVAEFTDDYLWRKYVNGVWSTEKFIPVPPAPGPDLPAEIKELKSRQADILFAMVTNNMM